MYHLFLLGDQKSFLTLSFQIPLTYFLWFLSKPMFYTSYVTVGLIMLQYNFHFDFLVLCYPLLKFSVRLCLKCDSICAETRIRLSAKRTSPFKSAGVSVQSSTGSRGVLISGSNAGYTKFRGSVKGTGYPLHSPVSLSLPLSCVTVCHHVSTGLYFIL